MVFVGGKKYACESCIKGHRSSSCRHTDRPLFEIKKIGRPATQCEHCRELRKTRQIHVKCVCESKDSDGKAGASSKGPKVSVRAAFPSGLPQELLLEASVASQPFSESDSDNSTPGCTCKDSATCTCATPRARGKRPSKTSSRRGSNITRNTPPSSGEVFSRPAALVADAHLGNKRPVLPKPPTQEPGPSPRISHDSSPSSRLLGQGQQYFDTYGRVHEQTRPSSHSPMSPITPTRPSPFSDGSSNVDEGFSSWFLSQNDYNPSFATSVTSRPMCNCGSSCACVGCTGHHGRTADPSAACTNPTTCVACLQHHTNTLPALASPTDQSMYEDNPMQNVDDWIRQMSSTNTAMHPTIPPSTSPSQSELRFDPNLMESFNMLDEFLNSQLQLQPQQDGGRSPPQCQCQPGLCTCGHSGTGFLPSGGSGRPVEFATQRRGQYPGDVQRARPSASASQSTSGYADGPWLAAAHPGHASSSSSSSRLPSSPSSPGLLGVARDGPLGAPMGQAGSARRSAGSPNTQVPSPSVSRPPVSSFPNHLGADHNQYRTSRRSSSGGHAPPFAGAPGSFLVGAL